MDRLLNVTKLAAAVVLSGFLVGCAGNTAAQEDQINDPFEATNRQVHSFNKAVDEALIGPMASVYGGIVPEEFRYILGNAVSNLGQPNAFLNHILQGDGNGASNTLARFLLNSTVGIAGMFDPAAEMGIFDQPTDFGETLAVWGVSEGPYIELPVVGPSTVRDVVGMLVDFGIDPVNYRLTEEQAYYLLAARALDSLGTRHEFDDLVNTLLYESADSYTAQRLSYLLNKRHALAGETVIDDLEDPYAFE